VDLAHWIKGTFLSEENEATALRLAAFLEAHGEEGRDKVTLLLPKSWEGAAVWTKQDFEESLGKSEKSGIKIVVGEKLRMADYASPRDAGQDRVFVAIRRKGEAGDGERVGRLRRAGYPVAVVTLPGKAPLSSYMQFIHWVVFGLGYLRNMNFVTQPSVELYKSITNRLHQEAGGAGGIRKTPAWLKFEASASRYRGVTLHTPFVNGVDNSGTAPAVYARMLGEMRQSGKIDHGELTFFGDTRYSARGRAALRSLDRAARTVFRSRLKMPADVYEGPAMNHSYHEMIIGHGGCFSTVVMTEKLESIPEAGYDPGYHVAQFLATQMALAERGRAVCALTLPDLESRSIEALDQFFRQVAAHLKV
jgi:hypothetical protein